MLTEEQKAARKIGGSDIAVILNLSPYKTSLELYKEKIGETPPFEGNLLTTAGTIMEAAISDLYEHVSGRKVRKSNIVHAHPKHDFLTANLDRVVVGEKRIVEIKNVSRNAAQQWGESGTDQVPMHYLMQVHHYLLVMDYPDADLVAYFGGGDLGIYPIKRSPDMDAIIIDAAAAFWECVQTKTPPVFDANHPRAVEALKRIYPGTDGTTVQGDEKLLAWSEVERDAGVQKARYEEVQDGAKAHLLAAMGEASVLTLPDGSSYTRKTVKRGAHEVEATEYVQLKWSKPK